MAKRRGGLTNPLALAVLATLSEGPMHPYEIARLLKYRGKDQSIKIRYGSLYTVVQSLDNRGLIAAEGTARAGRRPERTVYRLTDEGDAELRDWLGDALSEPVKEYPLFESALSLFGVLGPDEVPALLAKRLRRLDVEIAENRAGLRELLEGQGLPRLFLLECEYALSLKQAEADWVRVLLGQMADGSLEGLGQWRDWHENRKLPEEWQEREWAQAGQGRLAESVPDDESEADRSE